jgi:hypothetical protein
MYMFIRVFLAIYIKFEQRICGQPTLTHGEYMLYHSFLRVTSVFYFTKYDMNDSLFLY